MATYSAFDEWVRMNFGAPEAKTPPHKEFIIELKRLGDLWDRLAFNPDQPAYMVVGNHLITITATKMHDAKEPTSVPQTMQRALIIIDDPEKPSKKRKGSTRRGKGGRRSD